jgi:hypothetical protein
VGKFGSQVEYVCLGDDFGPIFSWVDGVLRAQTEFVKILFDDDVLDPDFVAQALPMMESKVGFVATNARLVNLDSGEVITDSLFGAFTKTGVFKSSGIKGARISRQMISPSALLLRKRDVVDGLYLGSLPFSEHEHHGAGPDHYLKLLVMLRYKYFGLISQSLVSFGAHEGSITVTASQDNEKQQNLQSVYDEVWIFYQQLRFLGFVAIPFKLLSKIVRTLESLVFRLRGRQ